MTNKYRKRFNNYIEIVLTKLPDDISEWAAINTTLHEPPEDSCVGFQFKSETKYHCVFPCALFSLPIKDRLFTIAHELAHCYIDSTKPNIYIDHKTLEQEADKLAITWGFSRKEKIADDL